MTANREDISPKLRSHPLRNIDPQRTRLISSRVAEVTLSCGHKSYINPRAADRQIRTRCPHCPPVE